MLLVLLEAGYYSTDKATANFSAFNATFIWSSAGPTVLAYSNSSAHGPCITSEVFGRELALTLDQVLTYLGRYMRLMPCKIRNTK